MTYPQSYHVAMSGLVHLDIMAKPDRIRAMRWHVARALRDCRKVFPKERVRRERDHMRYVNGAPWMREWFKGW